MRRAALGVGLCLLTGCSGSITFRPVELMAMVDDERARYNLQASLVNRACVAHALPAADCAVAADDGKEAVKQYLALRKRLLAKETVTADSVIQWLLVIGSAIAKVYGIPIPAPPLGAAPFAGAPPVPTLPLMP